MSPNDSYGRREPNLTSNQMTPEMIHIHYSAVLAELTGNLSFAAKLRELLESLRK